jgi:colanic acid/amylovoran biosynthesis glycosyltransferase
MPHETAHGPAAAHDPDPPAGTGQPVRLAYIVARFPKITETFVVRELNEVNSHADIDAHLFALFRPQNSAVHPSAARWVARVHRPSLLFAVFMLLRWFVRRPYTVLSTTALLLRGFGRHPRLLLASLGAMVVAAAHADTMRRMRIEHVHAHFAGNTATAAWVIQRLTGIGYSITAHAYDLFQDQDFLQRRTHDARFVITISRFNAAFLRELCGDGVPPISVIRAGVDLTQFRFTQRTLHTTGPVRALCVASLMLHKGHRVLLEALASDDQQLRRITVDIVGEGPLRSSLEEQVALLRLADRVRLHGALPENMVADMFDRADLFILPSVIAPTGRMEGVPVVLMEALACGVPAVATRLSGVPELVEDGVTGTLADQGSVESLRSALLRVLADPTSARIMSEAGRQRVVDEYDVRASAASLSEKFVDAARASSGPTQARPSFIAWSRSERSSELAHALDGDCQSVFFTRLVKPALVPFRYLVSAVTTSAFLMRRRPSVVVATNPPIFPALIAYLYGRLTRTDLVLDSHPRGFGHKGSRLGTVMAPVHSYLVRRALATLVASDELARTVTRWGGRPLIVHEAPPLWAIDAPPDEMLRPTVMWVCIYAQDEPLADVLKAARSLPDYTFLVTGDVRKCPPDLRAGAPSNVEFTGYWAHDDFSALIRRSHIMLVLTTERTSVPRAAFEAIEALRPLVLSDWPHLRGLFPSAVWVSNSPESIAAGVRRAVEHHDELVAGVQTARDRQRGRWRLQRAQLVELLRRTADGPPGDRQAID